MKNNRFFGYIKALFQACRTEFKLFFGDSALYVSLVILTILVAYLYSTVYKNEIIQKSPIVVVDMDHSSPSRELTRMLDATQQVHVLTVNNDMSAAKKQFDNGEVFGILYIPKGFEKDVTLGNQTSLSLYSDAANMLHNKSISSAMAAVSGTFSAQLGISKSMRRGLNYTTSVTTRSPANAITKNVNNPYGGYATFLLPVVYLIIIQTLLLSAIGVLGGTMREKNNYFSTYGIEDNDKFKIVPVLIGRSLAYILLCVLVFCIIYFGCVPLFKLPFRSTIWETLSFLVPFFLADIFLGFSLMGIFKRREDAAMSMTFTSIPAVFLTGVSWPVVAFPHWVKIFAYIFPTTVGARGFLALSQFGSPIAEIKDLWGQMWLTALFYFLLAVLVNYRLKIKDKNELVQK